MSFIRFGNVNDLYYDDDDDGILYHFNTQSTLFFMQCRALVTHLLPNNKKAYTQHNNKTSDIFGLGIKNLDQKTIHPNNENRSKKK